MNFTTVQKSEQTESVPQLTIAKVQEMLQAMSPLYDIVRLVNPSECFELSITKDGKLHYQKNCFSVWGRTSRCKNCISYQACVSHKKINKSEILDGEEYVIDALPVEVIMATGELLTCTIEMVSCQRLQADVKKAGDAVEEMQKQNNGVTGSLVSVVGENVSNEILTPLMRLEMLSYADANDIRGSICFDKDGKCIYANQQAFKLLHVEKNLEKLGEIFAKWACYDRVDECSGHIWRQNFTCDNKEFTYVLQHLSLRNKDGKELGDYFSIRDYTRETSNYTTAKFNLSHDLLTRIYNLNGFGAHLRERLNTEPDRDFDLVQIKLRGFNLILQLFGTNKCDQLLISLAQFFASLYEPYQALYGRIGRDSFILCLPHGTIAKIPMEENLKALAGHLMGRANHVHYQIGIYETIDRGCSYEQMLDRTTMALNSITTEDVYAVKTFKPEMLLEAVRERRLLNDFDDALRNGEFHLFLQPQIGLDGKMHRAEALSRWFHKDRGMLMPIEFIPLLERTDDIYRMDYYIWEQAAKQLAIWEKSGHGDIAIAVNVSPRDLYYGDVVNVFPALAEKYHIDPGRLHLEITESTIIDNFDACNEIIKSLRKRGFSVGLDDFGSGYSSLNMLQNLHVDILKLDMGFLQKLDDWERGMQIIKLVIDLAKSLHMEVVAEGVETKEQALYLQKLKCDYLQGYYYSKPVSVEQFEAKYFA